MSNDLISRIAVYNKLLELEEWARNLVLDTPTNSPCYQRYVEQLNERTALKHFIADVPAVYDVDKTGGKGDNDTTKLIDGITECCGYDFGLDIKNANFCPVCGKKIVMGN